MNRTSPHSAYRTQSGPSENRSRASRRGRRPAVAAAIGSGLLAAVLLAGCASDDGPEAVSESTTDAENTDAENTDAGTTDTDTAPELAPPTVIDLSGASSLATESEISADRPGSASEEMTIAPEPGDGDMAVSSDDPGMGADAGAAATSPPVGDMLWLPTIFTVSDSMGPLPTDDVAYHYPTGAEATIEQVRALAAQLGIAGEPTPGDRQQGSQWVVEPNPGGSPRLEVANDAVLSWWFSGGNRRPDQTATAPGGLGRIDYASGYLAEAIPTGPYPLIDLDQAIDRLGLQWGQWSYPVPDEEIPLDQLPEGYVVELISVEADLYSSWAADQSMWMIPAYTFRDANGSMFTVPAITDEYLVQVDQWYGTGPTDIAIDPPVFEEPAIEQTLDEIAAELVGLTFSEADEVAAEREWMLRIARQDGQDLAVTADYMPRRVNVAVDDQLVVEVLSVG